MFVCSTESWLTVCLHLLQVFLSESRMPRNQWFHHPQYLSRFWNGYISEGKYLQYGSYPSRTYGYVQNGNYFLMLEETFKRTASPNGRVSDVPPKNRFQIRVANSSACSSEVKVAAPVAPPMLNVTILPIAWHVWMSDAMNWQFASSLPGNTGKSTLLQI
jgi:hypothetical protein